MSQPLLTAPLLTTERFELWCPRGPQDVEPLCRLIADDETRRFLGPARAEPQSQWERLMRNAGSWSLYGYGVFYVRAHGSDELIGSMGVFHSWRGLDPRMDDQPEAGWIVRSDWGGKGVAGEVMQAALAWFDVTHGAARIVAMIEHENAASHRVAAKLGFSTYAAIPDAEGRAIDLYERLPR
ncbi:GNAT family N-acetyltransferase [Novosphingobium sp. 9U]|uniref:GNAT family N-acetyltransferase n=1 Tax=Novosphingobium sp. 9U TaxID=2653158 RepID=UPI0012F0811F|nr:GNAT family N-acetyltransferase [Novosphingobium sp. 9U]VWX53510.1 GCN5 family acetyltransferase [Novosphingobium sp. 9U]